MLDPTKSKRCRGILDGARTVHASDVCTSYLVFQHSDAAQRIQQGAYASKGHAPLVSIKDRPGLVSRSQAPS